MGRSSFLRWSLLAALALSGSTAVTAVQAAGAGRLIERVAQRHATRAPVADPAGTAVAEPDTTRPVLTLFDAGTTWTMSRSAAPLSYLVKGTDERSGVSHILIEALGPGGQQLFSLGEFDYPAKSVSRRFPMNTLFGGRLLQPGAWTIMRARLVDLAGNSHKLEAAALAALGNTAFTVVNDGSFDNVAPTLVSGQVLTPVVSLSAPAQGTTQARFAGVKIVMADSGASGLAGAATAHAAFCLADESRCLDMIQATPTGGAPSSVTVTLGLQVSPILDHAPGEYLLYEVVLIDHAGNARELLSTTFGGSTNFSTLIPDARITLTP